MTDSVVGKPIDRVDARKKVTGTATYAAEVPVTNIAHAVIAGSAIARGTITSIDVEAARKAPGVIAVITHLDAPKLPALARAPSTNVRVIHALQDASIQYADQPIALVIADTLERAQHAARLVTARYAALPPLHDLERDVANAYVPVKGGPRGEPTSTRGNVDAGLRAATATIDATYTTPVETHNPMEPHATIAAWQGNDKLTLYDSTQGIFGVRERIADVFGLRKQDVRVINHFVGGGFGCKGAAWSHVVLAVMAARLAKRPVKLVLTRPQMFALVGHRPKTVQHVVVGADARGTLTAIRHDVMSETSRFDEFMEPSALQTRMLYACPNVTTSHSLVRVDIPTPTFTRAPGEATGSFALESALDELAHALHVDPVALRVRNHADADPDTGKPWSSKSLRECYARGAAQFGWSRRKPAPRSMRDGDALIGWGMASATYPARQLPASAIARMRRDGTALVQAGTQDIGTGTYTIMTQIAADALGLPIESVRFELGDTDLPETPLSAGSFTASSTGSAVKLAGDQLRQRLVALAIADSRSPLFGAPAEAIEATRGLLVLRGDRGRRDSFAAIVARTGAPEVTAEHHTDPRAERERYSTHAFGAAFAEVRIDPDLGELRVTRFVGAYGCGKILNPKTARSQLAGGVVWGIGMALHEHTELDPRTARAVTRDLVDYHMPVHADVPAIEILMVPEEDLHVNELGAKGLGEIGNTGAAAAIANAVFHATGTRVRALPITLDKLLDATRAP